MNRTYLVRVSLNIAVAAALSGAAVARLPDDDDDDAILYLLPEECLLLSTAGNTILFTHRTDQQASEVLTAVQEIFARFTVDGASVLEVGSRCKTFDPDLLSTDESHYWDDVTLESWLADEESVGSRTTFGPKALVFVTRDRDPKDLSTVQALRRSLRAARPHWHGRNSLMLALNSDNSIADLWGHHAVQIAVRDRQVAFAACLEVGPTEASMHGFECILPTCERTASPPKPKVQTGPVRTVVVEYRRGEKGRGREIGGPDHTLAPGGGTPKAASVHNRPRLRDPLTPPPANDHLRGANDNRRATVITVEKRVSRHRPKRSGR